jgi:hypothetical protein
MTIDQQRAHALLDQVPANQITVALRFLEFLLLSPVEPTLATAPHEDEEISDEEEAAVARSKEWFKHNEGIPFEQVVGELGFSMEQIRSNPLDDQQFQGEKEPAA